ncbi:MAG TPA: thiol:disulfide interchange protein DsbA/DsbL [Thiobacillaceae bacterium]|nr:thiol:disulfide interchange protein DsbA/DsbL [Thiobacillaceae bacterium]HNU63968.1 thiol:disulfide interchange protein DsbA/DsbL [Thiobacillaceae bacterium]
MHRIAAAILLALSLLGATSGARAIEAGIDYVTLSPAQRTDAKAGQVEVLEFFWYRCPHCAELEPELQAWAKKLPRNVVLRRVPAILNDSWLPLTRAYYALEALGQAQRLHGEVFTAIHKQGVDLNDPETFFDWAATKGVDRQKLAGAYQSFGVNSKVMRARQMTQAYKLNGVPALTVNGKYTTSAYMTGSHARLFETLDALIARELKGKRGKR